MLTLLIAGVMLVAFAASAIAGANRVALCHQTGTGDFVKIEVAEPAVPAHMRHGDVPTDEYGECP